jgi:hypothetical protein
MTDFKSVDMSTNEEICFFSADCRPGTNFLCRLSPRGSEPSLFPKDRKTRHPVAGSPAKNTEIRQAHK